MCQGKDKLKSWSKMMENMYKFNSVYDVIFVYIYVTMVNNPTVESNKKYMNLHRRLPESNKILVLAMQIDFFISWLSVRKEVFWSQ